MGWAGIGSAFLIPCLWIKGTGSMFRGCTQAAPADVAPVAEEKQSQAAPSSMPGPQPTFVPAPGMTFQPTMGQPQFGQGQPQFGQPMF
jgi:hypothetical protein